MVFQESRCRSDASDEEPEEHVEVHVAIIILMSNSVFKEIIMSISVFYDSRFKYVLL